MAHSTVRASVHGVADGEIDAVTFTSAPGAHAWLAAARDEEVLDRILEWCRNGAVVMAAVGPVTAEPLRDNGIEPLIPDRGRLGALVRTLVGHYERAHTTAVCTSAGRLQVRRTVALLDGHVLPLSRTGLEVLRLLVEAGGEVVTRGRPLETLPGDSTDPHTAEVAIARVREVCGGTAVIQTVAKRGYRLAVTGLSGTGAGAVQSVRPERVTKPVS